LSDKYNGQISASFTPSDSLLGTPPTSDANCVRNFGTAYKCGPKPMDAINVTAGNMVSLDCTDYKKTNCEFYLLLNDNGIMGLYKGKESSGSTSSSSPVWSVGTSNNNLEQNVNWTAVKGKFGRNYVKMTETLVPGDWVGSPSGKIRLIMLPTGNLVLQTSKTAPGCSDSSGNKYGATDVNAIYQVNEYSETNKSEINKLAFIDADSNLREYPGTMFELSNNYISYFNYDSPGNDISNTINTNSLDCVAACNANNSCVGYVYNNGSCALKKGTTASLIAAKQVSATKNVVLGLKTPRVKSNLVTTCGKNVANIDTVKYQKYVMGSNMNENVGCSTTPELNPDFTAVAAASAKVSSVASKIVSNINNLGNIINQNKDQMNINKLIITSDISRYHSNKNKINNMLHPNTSETHGISGFQNLNSNSNYKEGMANHDQHLNINDIDHMLNDSDIRILQANYSYILWSVLAVGILSITVNTIKK
jgi:hypothetical protein